MRIKKQNIQWQKPAGCWKAITRPRIPGYNAAFDASLLSCEWAALTAPVAGCGRGRRYTLGREVALPAPMCLSGAVTPSCSIWAARACWFGFIEGGRAGT